MAISWQQQGTAMLLALGIGVALGLLYDILRPARRRGSAAREACLDLLYWLAIILVVFLLAPRLGRGYVRLYMMSAHLLGAVCYFCLFSKAVRRVLDLSEACVTRLTELICRPFVWISTILTAQLEKYFLFLRKSAKKIFSFCYKWFTIRIPLKKSEHVPETGKRSEEDRADVENKKGWSCD